MLYPQTIDDDETVPAESSSDEEDEGVEVKRKRRKKPVGSTEFSEDFTFGESELQDVEDHLDGLRRFLKKAVPSTLQEKIEKERKKAKTSADKDGEDEQQNGDANGHVSDESDDDDIVQALPESTDRVRDKTVKQKKKKGSQAEKEAFFDPASSDILDSTGELSFHDLNLSRPLLKAITESGFARPTPIQSACIPVALAGKDVCACSATGTGKTAAFMLPILERLLYRPKQKSVTRVLVLVPTRELAIQVFQVSRKLAQFCNNVEICLCAGGLDVKAQEAALRMGLDIVIATPGRLIDHLHNSPNFSLADIEVLVLDEADRMLEEAFADQMKELIRLCSKNRQTMLFSATMTDEIEDLARMSLNKPVRLFINDNTDTAMNLRQEFVRIRENKEEDREGVVAALVTRNFPDHAIVFVRTKRDCERLHVLLGLLGVKAAQLHGGLSQSQRVQALAAFKSQEIGVLCSTDLAARGLDIDGVMTVINLHMPMSLKHYVHRVGRTARAGKAGRSISLVGENDRTLLKSIVKMNKGHPLKQRVVAPDVINAYKEKIQVLNDSVKRIEEEEKTERAVRQAEVALEKTEEKLKSGAGAEERVWFQSSKEKKDEKKRIKADFKKKQQEKEKVKKTPEEIQADRIAAFQAREAKRARRGKKIRTVVEDSEKRRPAAAPGNSRKRKKSSFTHELTSVGAKSVKKFRHGPEDMDFKNAKRAKMQKGAIRRPRK